MYIYIYVSSVSGKRTFREPTITFGAFPEIEFSIPRHARKLYDHFPGTVIFEHI